MHRSESDKNVSVSSMISSSYPGFSVSHHKISQPMEALVEAAPTAFVAPANAPGELSFSINGGPEQRHTLLPNSILIAGLSPVSWRMRTAPADVLVLEFSADIQSRIDNAGWIGADPVHIVQDELFHRIATLLLPSIAGGCRNGCVFADNLAATLIAHVDRNYGPSSDRAVADSGDRLPASVLREIHDTVESRLSEPLRVRELADVARLSEFHFLRAFKRSTGMSPHQYITERRISRARTLLSTTDVPVAEIAWRVGLINTSHFNAQFRKYTGMTPGAWRDQGASATRLVTV
jgi:AraC family transcriptional regulator